MTFITKRKNEVNREGGAANLIPDVSICHNAGERTTQATVELVMGDSRKFTIDITIDKNCR